MNFQLKNIEYDSSSSDSNTINKTKSLRNKQLRNKAAGASLQA